MDSSIEVNNGSVQHVTKKSSDQLLRKFAEVGSEPGAGKRLLTVVRRRRRRKMGNEQQCESPVGGGGVVERKWLIPSAAAAAGRKKIGIGSGNGGRCQHLRIRDFRKKSILGAIQKTWRRTVEGATKVLLEKHYNTHRRLISDTV